MNRLAGFHRAGIFLDVGVRGVVYDVLRRLTPRRLRGWLKRRRWFMPLLAATVGEQAYSKSYYEDVERLERESVQWMAEWITRYLRPSSVIDVGCGPGHLMAALASRGVRVYGVDISSAALRAVRSKGLHAERFDLRDPHRRLPGGPYELAISCEVAEHLEEQYAGLFVRKLTEAAPVVYMTAYEPKPGVAPGLYHVNEKPHTYWIQLMSDQGYVLDKEATENARAFLNREGVIDYLRRPLIFRAAGS